MSKLIIKAANGSVEDFPVDAPSEWTILELKRHLHGNYPNKPEVSFQKLVCGGKLLHDETKITEVVSNATGSLAVPPSGDPLVVHLVVYDRSMSAPSAVPSSTSTRSGQGSSSRSANSSRSSMTGQEGERAAGGVVPPHGVNEPMLGNQGLRFRMGVPPQDPNIQNLPMFMPGGGAYPYPMAPPPQFYMSPYGQMYANQFQQWYNAYYGPREGVQEQNDGGGGGAGEQHPLDLPVNGNGRNNNDGPDGDDAEEINAPGGVGMMGGGAGVGGGLRQRDMVDYLYMFMMISFLIFVAYVTNSLGRLVIFTAGVIFMLLNQGGFFALRRRRVAVHGEEVPDPDPPQNGRGQERDQEQGDQVDGQNDEGRRGDTHDQGEADSSAADSRAPSASPQTPQASSDPPPVPPAQNVPPLAPGLLNTLYVFITSFFTSLVPQQRPELEIN